MKRSQYLTFTLGHETLGLGIPRIKEILGYREPTPVLRMPPHVRGVINLRGSVVPVLDLSIRFARQSQPIGRRACILVVEADYKGEKHILGVIVDAVNEVLAIGSDDIEAPPPFGGTIRSEFLEGLAKVHGRFVALLDAGSVFDMTQLARLAGQSGHSTPKLAGT